MSAFVKLAFKLHNAEAFGLMKAKWLGGNRTPREVICGGCKVGTLKAIGANAFALCYLKIGEKAENEAIGNSVKYLPTRFG